MACTILCNDKWSWMYYPGFVFFPSFQILSKMVHRAFLSNYEMIKHVQMLNEGNAVEEIIRFLQETLYN